MARSGAARSGAAAAAAYELPPPELSNAISGQYGRHIDLNSKDSTAAVSKLCDCFDLLFEPKWAVSRRKSADDDWDAKIEVLEIQQLKEVLSSKKHSLVSIRSLLLMNAHSTLIPIEKPCDRSLLSADPLLSAKAAIAARGAAGEPPYNLRRDARAGQGAVWAAWMAPMPREVCLDLQVSHRFLRFNFVYILRGLLRLNVTNDFSLDNDYKYLANVRLDEDPDLKHLFSGLNHTIEESIENYEQMLELLMAQVNQQGEGRLTKELKNNIRDSLHTFTPIWPESVQVAGLGAGAGAETFKHRIVVITNGENDRYEPNPIWRKQEREAVMQKLAFGISFKAVLIIQTSNTKRICMDFVLNLNKTKLFTEFSHLFTGSTCVPYLQCWFYLDDFISIILESDEFKTRISKVLSEKIQNSGVILQSIKSAYDDRSSSFAVVDTGCNHPVGYLSPDPGPSAWTWNDVNFEIIGEEKKECGHSVMVNLLHRPDLRQEAEAAGAKTVFHCTFPESMRPAFTTTRFTDPVEGLYEGQFSLGEDSLRAVSGSQIEEEEAAAAAAAPESPARRIVANIFKTIHTLWGRVVCRFGSGSGSRGAAAAVRPGGASKKKRKSIRTRRASRASRASRARRARRSRRSRK